MKVSNREIHEIPKTVEFLHGKVPYRISGNWSGVLKDTLTEAFVYMSLYQNLKSLNFLNVFRVLKGREFGVISESTSKLFKHLTVYLILLFRSFGEKQKNKGVRGFASVFCLRRENIFQSESISSSMILLKSGWEDKLWLSIFLWSSAE